MPDVIRELNDAGLAEFATFIKETRQAEKAGLPKLAPPFHLLSDPAKSTSCAFQVEIDRTKVFGDRFELAIYLSDLMGSDFTDELYRRPGLWAWLALAYFGQLRAIKRTGTQRAEHFIPDEWAKQTPGQDLGYRHCVRTPFQLVKGHDESFARFLLTGRPANEMGDIVEQVVSRPKLVRSERIRATMLKLYQSDTGGFKRGAASEPAKSRKSEAGRGGLRRFAHVYVPRVKLGFDIDEMQVPAIITACGPEISSSRFAS